MNRKILVIVLMMSLLMPTVTPLSASSYKQNVAYKKEQNFRGVWVASVFNIDFPTSPTTSVYSLKNQLDKIVEDASAMNYNAIFFQVRPTSDSLYKSKYFPWSKWLTGQQGLAPEGDFDPLDYIIKKAHSKNIELHAWINPYRITKKTSKEPDYTTAMLAKNHPARRHPEYVIAHNGNLYYDPALRKVRDLIARGIKEILVNYDVDGIHFDDYFYPAKDFNDSKSFKKYGKGLNREDWRRKNVNLLIKKVNRTIKRTKPDALFSVSPFGIWANKRSRLQGSATTGAQSYSDHYADTVYWVKNSMVDMIIPQIYWRFGFEVADFKVLTDWWNNVVKGTDVKLCIGIAAYKGDNPDETNPWHKDAEIDKQISYISALSNVNGYVAYNIRSIQNSFCLTELFKRLNNTYFTANIDKSYAQGNETGDIAEEDVKSVEDEIRKIIGKKLDEMGLSGYDDSDGAGLEDEQNDQLEEDDVVDELEADDELDGESSTDNQPVEREYNPRLANEKMPMINFPARHCTAYSPKYFVGGLIDPNKPAFLNGEKINSVTRSGFFGKFISLKKGKNNILLKQNGKSFVRVITRKNYKGRAKYLKHMAIKNNSAYPNTTELYRKGEKIKLSCIAPRGLKVVAKVSGKTFILQPNLKGKQSKIETAYSHYYSPNLLLKDGEYFKYPKVEYKLYKNNKVLDTKVSKSSFIYADKNADFYAEAKTNGVNIRVKSNTKGGSAEKFSKGEADEVEIIRDGMIKFTSGRFVEISKMNLYADYSSDIEFNKAYYTVGNNLDKVKFNINSNVFAKTYLEDDNLIIQLGSKLDALDLYLPKNNLVSGYQTKRINGRLSYVLNLKNKDRLAGFWKTYEDGNVVIYLKHKKNVRKNLIGTTIMIDAGHGGKDSGALGLVGTRYTEKDVNLDVALKLKKKLEKLKANVILTRSKDKTMSLDARLNMVNSKKPDLFISIHSNSAEANKDLNLVKGFSAYYSKQGAERFANIIQDIVPKKTGIVDNKARTADFYVIRSTCCPSVLLELAFMPNPEDFDLLVDDKAQEKIASSITRAVFKYFKGGGR